MDKDKLKEYIDLCTPSFLIKMKTKNDKSYFFKAYKSDYNETGVLKFTIADVDVVEEGFDRWREINLFTEFGENFKSLKEVIIPEHKDMYKDIEKDGMRVACSVEDECSGDKLQPPPPPAPTPRLKGLINKYKIGFKKDIPPPAIKQHPPKMPSPNMTPEEVQNKIAPMTHESSEGFEDATDQDDNGTWWVNQNTGTSSLPYHSGGKKKKKRRKKRSRSKKRRNKRKNRTKKN